MEVIGSRHQTDEIMTGRYMGNMYTLDAFNTSNPADQDILSHYKMQQVDRP